MSEFLRDLRFGIRLLNKSPVFTITAVLLLATGISANTLIFSVVDALLLRPLPVAHPENLVRLVEIHPTSFVTWTLPYALCDSLNADKAIVSEAICQGETDVAFSDGTSTERVRVHLVSPNFFSTLGVTAHLGRVLNAEDERARAANAVLSYDYWRRRFNGDPSVIGRRIFLRGQPFTIVGVSREGFNGLTVDTTPDLRVPASVDRVLVDPFPGADPSLRPTFGEVFARLDPGVPLARANSQIDSALHRTEEDLMDRFYPPAKGEVRERGVLDTRLVFESVANGVSTLRQQFSRGLEVLMAGVALLLLMACSNVAGLLLARSAARAQEMGVRLALGASAARIVRQLLTEGMLLALAGGLCGMLLTYACLPLLVRGLPPIRDRAAVLQPLAVHIDIDVRVLVFAIAITLLTVVLFALSPALRGARADLATALRGSRTTTSGRFAGNLAVIAQVAMCTLILIGASLFIETLEHMRSMNVGFDSAHVVTFSIDPSLRAYTPAQSRALSKALLEKVRALPGVADAAIASRGLMRGTGVKMTVEPAGTRIKASDFLNSSGNDVTPGYFQAMAMRVLAGRDFNWFDRNSGKPRKVIVNEVFARRFFPGVNPIGKVFGGPSAGGVAAADNVIVGVVSNAKYRSLREPVPPTVYNPAVNGFESAFILHVRTASPEAVIAPVRKALDSLDPGLPFIEIRTLREEIEASLWQERLLAALATIFGAIATLLACIGLYGALDYAVRSRTREIGVRLALGAAPRRIAGLVSRETLLLLATGIALGLAGYATVAASIRRILYGVASWDPAAIVSVVVFVALAGVIATLPSTVRAVRVDPASALRVE